MARLEDWLEQRYPNAAKTLALYSAARQRGENPTGAREHVDRILQLILFHARRDEPYRTVLDWRRLRDWRPDLPISDLKAFQIEAEQVALSAAHALLDQGAESVKASLASQIKTRMRRALRHWIVETEVLPDPRTGSEVPSAETIHVTADDTDADEEGDGTRPGLRKMLGREGLGVVQGGHNVTVGPRVAEGSLPPGARCLQCGQRNLRAWWSFHLRGAIAEVLPGGTEIRRNVAPKLVDGVDFPFCGLRCEAEFNGRSHAPLTETEVSGLAQAIVAAAGSEAFGKPGLGQARAVAALAIGDRVPSFSDMRRVDREVWRVRRSFEAKRDPASVLGSLDREIWERRNDGYGSVARHLKELARRGIRMTAAQYRQRRKRAVERVNEAATARRILGPGEAA